MSITAKQIDRTAKAMYTKWRLDIDGDDVWDCTARWAIANRRKALRDQRRKILARFGRMSIGEILSEIGKRKIYEAKDIRKGFEP